MMCFLSILIIDVQNTVFVSKKEIILKVIAIDLFITSPTCFKIFRTEEKVNADDEEVNGKYEVTHARVEESYV